MLATFQVGQVLWSMLWFTIFFLWIMIVIRVFVDIFRSHDLSGGLKAVWTIFIIFVPYLGVFIYLIARGGSMAQRDADRMQQQDAAMKAYVRDAAGTGGGGGAAAELAQLEQLKANGTIDDAEFAKMKAKIIG